MKILFVYTREIPQSPVKPLVDLEAIQFGISYISSVLKDAGHETRLLVLTKNSDFQLIDNYLATFPAKLVCFTSVASEFKFVSSAASYFKEKHPAIYLIAGGPHVSLNASEEMLEIFNALCIGEGEYPTLELAGQLEKGESPAGIPNLWIRTSSGIEKNPTREFIQDLDVIPFPDRDMWDEWIDFSRSSVHPSLLLGRGCPFECSYCCNHALKKLSSGRYVRLRSPENVAAEVRSVIEKYKRVKEIYFEIETLGTDFMWVSEFCEKLKQLNSELRNPISFGANLRVSPPVVKNADALMSSLKEANFSFLNIGLESGSDRVRREILNRNYSNEDFLKVVNAAKRQNFQVILFDLIGLPGETPEDFLQTVEANRQANPNWYYLSIFFPYPGTDLHERCVELNVLPANILSTDKERIVARMDYPAFSRKQIQKAFICFDYYVFRDRKPTDWLADRVVDKYHLTYSKASWFSLLLIILCDFFSPARKIGSGLKESDLYFSVLRKYIYSGVKLLFDSCFLFLLTRGRKSGQGSAAALNASAPNERMFQIELMEEYVKMVWENLGLRGKAGIPLKIAVFGAGSHTLWLYNIVSSSKLAASPAVVAVLDENPQAGKVFWGLAPVKPESFDPATVDAILLSSDVFAEKMKSRLLALYGSKCICINIYENLPPGPYPKRK